MLLDKIQHFAAHVPEAVHRYCRRDLQLLEPIGCAGAQEHAHVAVRRDAHRPVRALDLRIGSGQAVALLGPNGAGKSTSIGMLLGLVKPSSGAVTVFGQTPDEAVRAGRVGAMLQDGGLMPGVRVAELIDFARSLHAHPHPRGDLLDDAGLTDIATHRVDRLSGGQAQRVRFALAIAGDPDLLVLDEPTSAMDVAARRAFWAHIRHYAARGRTVLFATHYLAEADEYADRIVVVSAGRIVTDGTPGEIKAAAGGRAVRFTIGHDSTAGLDLLPGVTAVEMHGAAVTLRTTDAEATLRALFASRDRVPDIEVSGADLEDAVLTLTR